MLTNISTNGRSFFRALGSICALCVMLGTPAIAQEAQDNADSEVKVSDYGTVDLAVQDTDLAQVLEMLSIQSRKNIITSKNVSATVTANLFDVTFYEALDSILHVNGYGYIEKGNFIYVYTQEELEKIKEANRTTESRVFELDYLSATDAQEFIQPLLSEDGKASVRGEVQTGFDATVDDGGADEYAYNVKVVVNDYPKNLEQVSKLLEELDVPPKQVMIEATVLQANISEENAFGVDFSVIGSVDFSDFANPLSGVNDLLQGNDDGSDVEATNEDESGTGFQPGDNSATAITSPVGGTNQGGGFKVGIMDDDISVFIRALDQVTDTTLLARPKLMALNRQRAEVRVAREDAFVGSINTNDNSTTQQETEFLETGIILRFRPFISENGMIRMELAPEVSSIPDFTIIDGNRTPNKSTNELTTNVRVRDGETIVLGGLFQEDTRITRRQVPFLGDVPLLGAAFRGQEDVVERREIIFLITPTIVHDEQLWEAGGKAQEHIDLLQLGAREGLLPFSREKTTENYNNDAMREFAAGNLEKALFYANNSLRLNTQQPEMRRLRQRITGEKERAYERNMLERIMRQEFSGMMDPANVSFDNENENDQPDQPKSNAAASINEYTDTSQPAKVESAEQNGKSADEDMDAENAQAAGENDSQDTATTSPSAETASANESAAIDQSVADATPGSATQNVSDHQSSENQSLTSDGSAETDVQKKQSPSGAQANTASANEVDAENITESGASNQAGAQANVPADDLTQQVPVWLADVFGTEPFDSLNMTNGVMKPDASDTAAGPNDDALADADTDGSQSNVNLENQRSQIMIDAWMVDFFKSLGLPDLAQAIEQNNNLNTTADAQSDQRDGDNRADGETESADQIANVNETDDGQK